MRRAFVIGNGLSRKGFDLNKLVGHGLIVGCNESYRTFDEFAMMCSIDGGITAQIKNDYSGLHVYKDGKDLVSNFDGGDLGYIGTGMNAGQLALKATIEIFKPDIIYVLGIDFGGGRVFNNKKTLGPSNVGWDTWKELFSHNVVRVGNDLTKEINLNIISKTVSNMGTLENECLTYREFNEHISFWERPL